MKRIESKTNLDLILEHYTNPTEVPLPAYLQKQLDRWDFANNLIKNYLSDDPDQERPSTFSQSEIAKMICKKFDVTLPTAYKDIVDSQLFFGNINKMDKNYWRQILFNAGMKALSWAIIKKDYDKVFKGVEKLAESLGLNKDDAQKELVLPNLYYMVLKLNKQDITINLNETHQLDQELVDQITHKMIEEAEIV